MAVIQYECMEEEIRKFLRDEQQKEAGWEEKGTMNTIGINNNLDRARIRKLLIIGLIGSIMTGIGDFLVGYGASPEVRGLAESMLTSAVNMSDGQLITGGLLGTFGLFLEGLAFFAIYRLMADAAPKYAHIYRSGIFGYIWLAPIGCHMNVGLMNIAYKNLVSLDPETATRVANIMIYAFCVPLWIILACFWIPLLIVQFKAFSKGLTPYPRYARWFNLFVGAIPVLVIGMAVGADNALGGGIGTTFLSVGNVFTFGGLLATLPSENVFQEFKEKLTEKASEEKA